MSFADMLERADLERDEKKNTPPGCPLICHDLNHNGDMSEGGCGNPKCWKHAEGAPNEDPRRCPGCLCPYGTFPGETAGRFHVRSVLGETRSAEIHAGGTPSEVHAGTAHPWVSCPFCTTAIYLHGPCPEHEGHTGIGIDGRCGNPWCQANPAMPLDAARLVVGQEHMREMAYQQLLRDSAATMRRIDDDREALAERWRTLESDARQRGACLGCLAASGWRYGKAKIVRHRGACPRYRNA